MSTLNVDKVDPSSGTALELGTSGDTITVPTGAGLTVVDEVKTNKVSPATGTAFALGDSGDTFTVPSGATIVNSGTATGFGITAASFRPNVDPIVVNGDMGIAQRSTSVTGTSSGNGWTTVDRFRYWIGTAGTWTITQETLTADEAFEDGFIHAWKWDCTTANGSLSAGSYLTTSHSLEARNSSLFKKGTSEAEVMTLAFWVKATKTGTNTCGIYDSINNRSIRIAYTIDSTDTWEKKVMTFAGDTSGPLGTGKTKAIEITWYWVAGTNYTSGTLQTSWASTVTANNAVGQVNNADSTSNNIHLTGVQLEVGSYTSSTIPPFQHESHSTSLARCKRFYQKFPSVDNAAWFMLGYAGSTTDGYGMIWFIPEMRDTPTNNYGTTAQWDVQGQTCDYAANGSNPCSQNQLGQFNSTGNLSGAHAAITVRTDTSGNNFEADAEI